MASTLSKQLLIERFPRMDPATLALILEDTNHSLHEATCLLSSAGHFQAEPNQETEQNDAPVSFQILKIKIYPHFDFTSIISKFISPYILGARKEYSFQGRSN